MLLTTGKDMELGKIWNEIDDTLNVLNINLVTTGNDQIGTVL